MEYVQERIATLHDLAGHVPEAPLAETAVVVPIAAREVERPAAEHTFETLAGLDVARVVVPVRAPAEEIEGVRAWLAGFDLPLDLLWCNAPAVEELLEDANLHEADGTTVLQGKGADVWLGLGVAADAGEYVVVHDADATSYDETQVPRLVAPLADGFDFTKGYCARVEDDGLYGRLCRLFYEPLLAALEDSHGGDSHDVDSAGPNTAGIVEYLGAFRYALAGEFATTADLATSIRAQRAWGLEIGTLGEAYRLAGPEHSAQVDLGIHRHDHRSVDGDGGLTSMSEQVGAALFQALADQGIEPDYGRLTEAYLDAGDRLVEQYAADAAHNGLPHDRAAEREQVRAYADAIAPPGPDSRLPTWADVQIEPADVIAASSRSLSDEGAIEFAYESWQRHAVDPREHRADSSE